MLMVNMVNMTNMNEKTMVGFYRGGIIGVSCYIVVTIYDYITNINEKSRDLEEKNKRLEEKNKYSVDENQYLKDEINTHMRNIEGKDKRINELTEALNTIRKRRSSDKIIIEYEDCL